MGNSLLNKDTKAQCDHAGQLKFFGAVNKVLIDGSPALIQLAPAVVSGCSQPGPPPPPGPCVMAMFTSGAQKVSILGFPALLDNSKATCVPTGASVKINQAQSKVEGK